MVGQMIHEKAKTTMAEVKWYPCNGNYLNRICTKVKLYIHKMKKKKKLAVSFRNEHIKQIGEALPAGIYQVC